MNVLVIGDRFSDMAVRYLSDIADSAREQMYVCSLTVNTASTYEAYWRSLYTKSKDASMSVNGMRTPLTVSIHDVLASRRFDAIVIHQGARESCNPLQYTDYLPLIEKRLHKYAPAARILVSEPWAYKDGSPVLMNTMGYESAEKMAEDIVRTVADAVENAEGIFGIVPFCEVLRASLSEGLDMYDSPKDPSDIGKYVLSLILYLCLSKKQVTGNKFSDFDTDIGADTAELAKRCAQECAKARGWRE